MNESRCVHGAGLIPNSYRVQTLIVLGGIVDRQNVNVRMIKLNLKLIVGHDDAPILVPGNVNARIAGNANIQSAIMADSDVSVAEASQECRILDDVRSPTVIVDGGRTMTNRFDRCLFLDRCRTDKWCPLIIPWVTFQWWTIYQMVKMYYRYLIN